MQNMGRRKRRDHSGNARRKERSLGAQLRAGGRGGRHKAGRPLGEEVAVAELVLKTGVGQLEFSALALEFLDVLLLRGRTLERVPRRSRAFRTDLCIKARIV